MSTLREVTWEEVFRRVDAILPQDARGAAKVYGVPRGGAVVAGLLAARNSRVRVVGVPQFADLIVDDVIDSGRTRDRLHESLPGVQFRALFDKTGPDKGEFWVRFPWEHVDQVRDIEDTVVRQLQMVGEDLTREGLRETPGRYLRALQELCMGLKADPRTPLAKVFNEAHDEVVLLRATPFVSLCEHHLLPVTGKVDFAYLPDGKVVGLSKIPRFIEILTRRPQVQERMTAQIADVFMQELKPKGVMVVVSGMHSCMHLRGVRSTGEMVTSVVRGVFKDVPEARAEVLQLMRGSL